jgi:hypothetical protein
MATGPYRELYMLLYAAARLSMWLAVFAAIFVPIERVFALHSQKIFRKGIAVDLGYYFISGLLPGPFSPRRFPWLCLASITLSRFASSPGSPLGQFGSRPAPR